MKIKNLLLACALLGAFPSVQAIPNWVAGCFTAGTGAVGAVSGFVITTLCVTGPGDVETLDYVGFGVGGILGGWAGKKFFFQFTPGGRMKRACATIERLQIEFEAQNGKNIVIKKETYSKQLDYAHSLAMAAQQADSAFTEQALELYGQIDRLRGMVSAISDTSKEVLTI